MSRIKGRFAPLTEELGSDERFLLQCTDLEKLLYLLIIYTCHMTRHQAPINPKYYRSRFGVRAHSNQIHTAINSLLNRFPKLHCQDGKLSLLNSVTYESQIVHRVHREVDKKKKEKQREETDEEWLTSLKANPLFSGVDFLEEFRKMDVWLLSHPERKKTRRFITSWLGRVDKQVRTPQTNPNKKLVSA